MQVQSFGIGRQVDHRVTTAHSDELEDGMVSVFVAVAMLVVLCVSGYIMQASVGVAQHERLQGAADLAALAAASRYVRGIDEAESCEAAWHIVRDLPDESEVVCAAEDDRIRVKVTADGVIRWLSPSVSVEAVAGPVE